MLSDNEVRTTILKLIHNFEDKHDNIINLIDLNPFITPRYSKKVKSLKKEYLKLYDMGTTYASSAYQLKSILGRLDNLDKE